MIFAYIGGSRQASRSSNNSVHAYVQPADSISLGMAKKVEAAIDIGRTEGMTTHLTGEQ